jgi:hypothetical protein
MEKQVYGPLKARGTLGQKQRAHLMLQFTTAAARDPIIHHYLANQVRRHATCQSVSRMSKDAALEFETMVTAQDFRERCDHARRNPKSSDAKALGRQVSNYVKSIGKSKPWGVKERENIQCTLLAMRDRYGSGSVFYTISLDDVHNVLSIRLCFPTKHREGFPSFSSGNDDLEAEYGEKMMNALQEGGEMSVYGSGDVRFEDGQLQRLAITNPTACSVAYHKTIEAVFSILFGHDLRKKKTMQIFDEIDGELSLSKAASDKGIAPGIFGVILAITGVTECSSRKALHNHGIAWTAASPEFLAAIADNKEIWSDCAQALESQVQGEVGLEVWL